jgi:hypothetical protein
MAADDHLNGWQLEMFMTPREIASTYVPLENDKHYLKMPKSRRPGEATDRWATTGGRENRDNPFAGTDDPQFKRNTSYKETDEQLMERKLKESKRPLKKWGGESLHASIAREGVQSPIRLSDTFHPETGSLEILGGHHRLAAALDTRPDDYVPVLHHKDIWEAKGLERKRGPDGNIRYQPVPKHRRFYPYS